jgi:hypothetical protein
MRKVNYRNILEHLKFHSFVVLRGFVKTIFGAITAGMLGLAIYGFILIESESGYLAVFDFVGSCALVTVAMCNVYLMGGKRKRGRE